MHIVVLFWNLTQMLPFLPVCKPRCSGGPGSDLTPSVMGQFPRVTAWVNIFSTCFWLNLAVLSLWFFLLWKQNSFIMTLFFSLLLVIVFSFTLLVLPSFPCYEVTFWFQGYLHLGGSRSCVMETNTLKPSLMFSFKRGSLQRCKCWCLPCFLGLLSEEDTICLLWAWVLHTI